mmetsp:Transcript_32794/g.52784  ORF Transcript_32794/g.52784 Transcript_32794/m.52784 type:complete len:128 (-) Transcript_32794:200-583(-)
MYTPQKKKKKKKEISPVFFNLHCLTPPPPSFHGNSFCPNQPQMLALSIIHYHSSYYNSLNTSKALLTKVYRLGTPLLSPLVFGTSRSLSYSLNFSEIACFSSIPAKRENTVFIYCVLNSRNHLLYCV